MLLCWLCIDPKGSEFLEILPICTFFPHVDRVLLRAGSIMRTTQGQRLCFPCRRGCTWHFSLTLKKPLTLVRIEPLEYRHKGHAL